MLGAWGCRWGTKWVICIYKKDLEDSKVSMENTNMLGQFEIEEEVVLRLLKSIEVDKSPGLMGSIPGYWWLVREEIAGTLMRIFVSSLDKKGNWVKPGNYRPVSLTSMLRNLFERTLQDRIYSHLKENGLVRDSQDGFVCSNKSSRFCLTDVIEFLTKAIHENRALDVVCMDFSEAFDKVPDGRLVQKIRMYRTHSDLVLWIWNCFIHRRRRLRWKVNILAGGLWPVEFRGHLCWDLCCLRYIYRYI